MRLTSTPPQEGDRTPGLFERGDLFGLALVAAAVLWTFVAATSGGDPWPMVGMFVLVAAAYAFGLMATQAAPFLVPVLVVTVAIVLGLLTLVGALPEGADAPPLGYVNARSAFFVVAAAAAVMLALLVRGPGGRVACLGLAAVLAFVPIFSRSEAASFVVVLLLLPAAAIALEGRRLAIAVVLSAGLLMATLAATSLVAVAPGSEPARLVGEVVGKRRVALWHDGLDLMVQEPLTGVGPGRFAAEAATAQTDFDARWAHHGFLQQGAEAGLVGLALLVLIFVWGFWRLALAGPSGMAVIGAFALGGLGILACSDYVFHFPLVTGATAALVGAAVAAPSRGRHVAPNRRNEGRAEVMIDAGLRGGPLQPIFQRRAERKLSVLAYHAIDHPERLEEHLSYLRGNAHPVSLEEVLDAIDRRTGLPLRAVLITFDDGDRSVLDVGLPALRSGGIPGVAFVVAGLLDSEEPFWWEEVEGLVRAGARLPEMDGQGPASAVRALKEVPDEQRVQLIEDLRGQRPGVRGRRPQLRKTDLAALESGGIAVGNHSLTHPCLGRCADGRVRREIGEAHRILESALGHRPESFAYPDGEWDRRADAALRDLGYRAAFVLDHRATPLPMRDPLRISRLRVNAATSMDRFRTTISGLPAIHHVRGGR